MATLAVATASAVLSWSALSVLAEQQGIAPNLSFLFPVTIDGSIVAAAGVTMASALRGDRAIYGWFVVALSSALSVFGNIARVGPHPSVTSVIVHATPSVMLLLSIEASLHLTRKRLALSALHAAAAAEALAKEEARAERARVAEVKATERERIAAEKTATARAAAEQRKAANAAVERAIGKTPKSESPGAEACRAYAATIEGFSDLPIARRVALLSTALGSSSAAIIDSGCVSASPDEERSVTARRVYKSLSRAAARTQGENAPTAPRRLNVA